MFYPEYGARVAINERYGYPSQYGTIVQCSTNSNWHHVQMDFDGQVGMFFDDEFRVTMTPSEAAHNLTRQFSVDEALRRMIEVFNICGITSDHGRYSSAVIFEMYRLNYYAEREWEIVAHGDGFESPAGFYGDSGSMDDDTDSAYEGMAQDDGTGYPVYRVED